MTEVSGTLQTEIDTPALDVLLQELVGELPPQVSDLLNNKDLHSQILQYLNNVTSIDSKDYLSSVPPTPGMDVQDERTLVQDIAELEASQRSIDSKLKSVIVGSQQLIIDNKTELGHSSDLFNNDFNNNLRGLWRTFNEDALEDMNEPQDLDLQELEADLEPNDKDKTFRTIVSNVKKLVNAETKDNNGNNSLSVVLENMEQIVNILELPSLTNTCIKAGYYSEALEVSSYTRRLAIRFPHSDLIREVEAGIRMEMSHMLTGLIRLLRTNLKQSSIIKIVSYLRRIQPFSQSPNADEQLKRILLHARYQFIKFELDSLTPLEESGLYEKHLKRSIEVIREHCFGSIMAYKNIFPDILDSEIGNVEIEIEKEDVEIEKQGVEVESEEAEVEQLDEEKEHADNGQDLTIGTSKDAQETETVDIKPESDANVSEESSGALSNETIAENTSNEDEVQGDPKEEAHEENPDEDSPANQESTSELESNATPVTEADAAKPDIELIRPYSQRTASNILLFDFVKHVLQELSTVLVVSLTKITENSIRDGLYLQLIYCSQSLGRIDQNFSDLMTAVLLNSKKPTDQGDVFLVDRTGWISAVEKQKTLARSLLSKN